MFLTRPGGDDWPDWVPCRARRRLCPNSNSGEICQPILSNHQIQMWICLFLLKNSMDEKQSIPQDTKKALKYQSKARRVRKSFIIDFAHYFSKAKLVNIFHVSSFAPPTSISSWKSCFFGAEKWYFFVMLIFKCPVILALTDSNAIIAVSIFRQLLVLFFFSTF